MDNSRFFFIILVYPYIILNNIFWWIQIAFTWNDPVLLIPIIENIWILWIIWIILWILIFYIVYKYFVKKVAKLIEKIIEKFKKNS